MKKQILAFVTVVALAVLVPAVLLALNNPSAGTWKLNTAMSKFSPDPEPQSLTLTLEAQDDGVKASSEGTAADGSATAWSYTANYDGKDNPISGRDPAAPIPLPLSASTRTRPNRLSRKPGK
jgi:hypothetical protein